MKTLKQLKSILAVTPILALFLFTNCETQEIADELSSEKSLNISANSQANAVDVISDGLNFHLPEEVPSGWTTFNYHNQTAGTHFFTLAKLPEGKTVADVEAEITPVFQEGMDYIYAGDFPSAFAAFGKLPEWGIYNKPMGGIGFVSGGVTASGTFYLEPGDYFLECYIKNKQGQFHSYLGMIAGLKVTGEETTVTEPQQTLGISISSTDGIMIESGSLRPGKHTIGVTFVDQLMYPDTFIGHDVHIAEIVSDDADLTALEAWVNWTMPGQLENPAPSGFKMLGGVEDMTPGATGYMDVLLKPGKYVIYSEVTNAMSKNMLHVFEVPTR